VFVVRTRVWWRGAMRRALSFLMALMVRVRGHVSGDMPQLSQQDAHESHKIYLFGRTQWP